MKLTKKLIALVSFALIVSMLAMGVSASDALKPTEYAAYGQQTLKAEMGGVPATVDGAIADGEYTNHYEIKPDTAGYGVPDPDFPGYPSGYDIYVTMDADFIWLGIIVHEAYYQYRVGSTAGSFMAFTIGPNMGNTFYNCMDRDTLTFNLTGEKELFKANTVMKYDADGKYTTSYNSNVYAEAAGARYEDKGITVYEAKIKRAEVASNVGLEKMEDKWYIHFEHKAYANAAMFKNDFFREVLTDEEKAAVKEADGWVASFAPHIIDFTGGATAPETKPASEETTLPAPETVLPEPETTVPASTTEQPAAPTTGDSLVAVVAVAVIGAAALCSGIILNRKHDN